jgi:hypothetical protein
MFHAIWRQLGFADDQNGNGPETSPTGQEYTPKRLRYQIVVGIMKAIEQVYPISVLFIRFTYVSILCGVRYNSALYVSIYVVYIV